jgi:MoaA/NifB/PqqE/SkfB family radical SAM enzyme
MDAARWANVVQLSHDYGAGRVALRGRPLDAYVEVAARCNLRCRMCPIIVDPRYQPGSGQPGLMADEVFDNLEPIFPSLKRAYLFGLGEPMLHPRIVDWTRRAAGAGVEVWITTNATLIDQAKADALAQAGLSRVSVSIDGGTAATYERIRQRGKWEDVTRGLAALGEAKRRFGNPRIFLNVVAMTSNLAELPELLELCARNNGDGVFVESLYAYEHPVIEEFVAGEHLGHLGRERVEEIFAEAHHIADRLGIELLTRIEEQSLSGRFVTTQPTAGPTPGAAAAIAAGNEVVGAPVAAATPQPVSLPDQLRMPWLCSEPWATLNINSAGEVRPCCFNDTVLGTLGPQTMEEIWNGAGYGGLRSDMTAGAVPTTCTSCVQQGRVKRNSYLRPATPATVPARRPLDVVFATPVGGEVVGDLVVLGQARRRPSIANWKPLQLDELPAIHLEGRRIAGLRDYCAVDGNWFAGVVPLGYVHDGAYELSFHDTDGCELPRAGRPQVQVGHREPGVWVATEQVAIPVWINQPERRVAVRSGDRRLPVRHWFCGAHHDHWLGVALVDVRKLPPGRHPLEIVFRSNPAFGCAVDRLPTPR